MLTFLASRLLMIFTFPCNIAPPPFSFPAHTAHLQFFSFFFILFFPCFSDLVSPPHLPPPSLPLSTSLSSTGVGAELKLQRIWKWPAWRSHKTPSPTRKLQRTTFPDFKDIDSWAGDKRSAGRRRLAV
ncbi:unnamed protein product [Cuscuta epithymum]|uniref:Uncharacterized protein n=1 Tax=Cuscuta epithymum TaxID=186058 RepID=A0AAV0GJC6_9ASTE|nr:unnamed protein product [Cuscuta epithymum]